MLNYIPDWIIDPLIAAAILGVVGFLFRHALTTFVSKAVEHKFTKRLEHFKASLRKSEKELDHIKTFVTNRKIAHLAVVESKRLEASEEVMSALKKYYRFNMLIEMIKIIDLDKVADPKNAKEAREFFATLSAGLNIDEAMADLGAIDLSRAKLYLSDRSLKFFDAYVLIVVQGITAFKFVSNGIGTTSVLKQDVLSKRVIELVPASSDGFDKFGETYAYQWIDYFHDELIKSMRAEILGDETEQQDVDTVTRLTISSVQAHDDARRRMVDTGLGEKFLSDDTAN